MSQQIQIEVAYARPDQQALLSLRVAAGSNVAQAIEASGVLAKFPEIDLAQNKVGIFGKLTKLDTAHPYLRERGLTEETASSD